MVDYKFFNKVAKVLLAHFKRVYFYKKEVDGVINYAVIDGDGHFLTSFAEDAAIIPFDEFIKNHIAPVIVSGRQSSWPEEFESLNCEPRRLGANGMVSVHYL